MEIPVKNPCKIKVAKVATRNRQNRHIVDFRQSSHQKLNSTIVACRNRQNRDLAKLRQISHHKSPKSQNFVLTQGSEKYMLVQKLGTT